MMKNKKLLFSLMLLFHVIVFNSTDDPLLNIEFLMEGIIIEPYDKTPQFILYHYVLNSGFMILLIATVLQAVSQAFEMRDYIITRCTNLKFKFVLLKTSLKNIFIILAMKQIIYCLFFLYGKSFTMFYFYDMASTFFTLLMYAQWFILFRLHGIRDKIPLFLIVGINMIGQMLSYYHHAFSILVTASLEWQTYFGRNIIGKIIVILLFSNMIYLHKNLDKTLGVKD